MDKKRITYLDIARGFAVFTMFLQHCMIIFEQTAGESTLLGIVFVLLGTAPAAPVFLLIMGVFMEKSSKGLGQSIVRGFKIMLLGYILNLMRFGLPILLAGEPMVLGGFWEVVLAVDIFQLAGLSMIVGAVLKVLVKGRVARIVLAFLLLAVSFRLWGLHDTLYPLAMLWGTGSEIYFPFFPWFTYPLLGMAFSQRLLSGEPLKSGRVGLIAGGLLLVGGVLVVFDWTPLGDYYRSGLGVHLLILAFVVVWLRCCQVADQWTGRWIQRVKDTLIFWSRNVTAIYFIQWVLFGWLVLLLGERMLPDYGAALVGLLVLIATHLSVKRWKAGRLFGWFGK